MDGRPYETFPTLSAWLMAQLILRYAIYMYIMVTDQCPGTGVAGNMMVHNSYFGAVVTKIIFPFRFQ